MGGAGKRDARAFSLLLFLPLPTHTASTELLFEPFDSSIPQRPRLRQRDGLGANHLSGKAPRKK